MSQAIGKSISGQLGESAVGDNAAPEHSDSTREVAISLDSYHCHPGDSAEFGSRESFTIGLPFGVGGGVLRWVPDEGKSSDVALPGSLPYVLAPRVAHTLSWSGSVDLLLISCSETVWAADAGIEVVGAAVLGLVEHDVVLWRIAALCRDLCILGQDKDEPLNAYTGAALIRRLGQLLREPLGASRPRLRRLTPDQWERVNQFVEKQLKYDIQVADLANQVGLGVGYFSELFKNTAGCAPFHYIKQRRMLKAHALLIQGGAQWRQVASLVGYSNSEHFSEVFRKFWGVAARQLLAQVNQPSGIRRR